MSDYVYLKNLNGQQIKPVTDLAAINMTTTNGIGVSTVNGGTIGIIDGYIESAYYTEMADPAVGAANVSSAYVDGGTAVAILGAYTVASAVDTAAPSQQKVPSEKAVVDALNNVVVSGVSYYAGTGINIDQGHTVSVANVPQSSVAGLENTLTGINTAVVAKQDAISAGYRMSLDGTTLNQKRYFDIESPTSATITLQAGHAYKITATNSSKTLDSEQIPANQFGLEGHAEIFVAGTGLIKTTSNVVLAQALEPDAVNNCTVRFHDGKAIISVEDHVAGYIVVSASGATAGTLPYALSTASNEYISFDASLNGQALDLGGATTYAGEKHVVGNGYTETILSGGINCTSKTTFANLGMNGVVISSGTLTMGDVYIPNGATVSVSGGGLAIEKVTGVRSESVIDFGGTRIVTRYIPAIVSNCQLKNGYIYPDYDLSYSITDCALTDFSTEQANVPAYAITNRGNAEFVRCLITGNTAYMGAVAAIHANCNITLTGCTFSNNSATYYKNAFDLNLNKGNATVADCSFTDAARNVSIDSASCTFSGTNSFAGIVIGGTASSLLIASGAIVDLTGNSNATPIAPSGTITFASGGATVKVGNSMASSSYMMDNVTLPAGAKLTNTNVVNLGSANCTVSSGTTASVSGATITSGFAPSRGGFANVLQGTLNVTDCTITGCTAVIGAGINASAGTVNLSGAIFSGNVETDIYGYAGTFTYINGGCTIGVIRSGDTGANWIFTGTNSIGKIETGSGAVVISSGASINLTSSINPGGGITFESGGATIVYSNGASSLKLGDYKVKSIESGGSVVLSGVQATDGVASGGTLTMPEGATAVYVAEGKHLTFSDCVASVYFAPNGVTAMGSYTFGGACYIQRVNKAESIVISSGAVLSLGYGLATESSGGIQVTGGTCTVNGVIVESGAYTSIDSNGSATL